MELKRLNDFATGGLMPDRTVLLELPPPLAAARMRMRERTTHTEADRMEKAGDGFHERLRCGFLELAAAEPERFAVVDANGTVDEVSERIWNLIQPMT